MQAIRNRYAEDRTGSQRHIAWSQGAVRIDRINQMKKGREMISNRRNKAIA